MSALARLEAALNLVDHIDPALATNQAVGAVPTAQRFQRVTDLHGTYPDTVVRPLVEAGYRKNATFPVDLSGYWDAAAFSPGDSQMSIQTRLSSLIRHIHYVSVIRLETKDKIRGAKL